MAEEEKEKITKKESEGKKKAEEDEDDDEEEDDEEDEYKDYLNSSDPPDQLALAFLAYLQRKQEKAAMQAAQAANAQAIVDRSQGKSKDCCISLLDDEDEPPSTVPAASSSETANKNLAPAKSAVISLLDDDDEIAKPPANGKPALSNEDIFGDDVKIKNEHVEEISSNMEVPEDVQNVASSNGIVDLSFEEDFNKPKAATTTPPDPDVMQPIMMEGAPQHFYWQGGMLPVANQQFQNFPIYQFSPQLLPSAPQTYLPDPHQFIPHGFDPSFGGGTQHIYMPSSFGNAMWQPEENATPGEQLSPLPPQSDSNNNSNPTGN